MELPRAPPSPLMVGKQFDNMKKLKLAVKKVALFDNFEIKVTHSDKSRYRVICVSDICDWLLTAKIIMGEGSTSTVEIRRVGDMHTCSGVEHQGHKQATAAFMGAYIEEKIRHNSKYPPKDIIDDVRSTFGVVYTYQQAWRAKEVALAAIYGSFEDAFNALPQYCRDIERNNPDSTVVLELLTEEHRFRRMFVCYGACASGFHFCRPVLGLDGTHLKSKYQGILLAATGVDAAGALFPLAYAVVDAENDDNWLWFIRQLHKIIEAHAVMYLVPGVLTILSDRQKGLIEGVETVFPDSPHGYCLRHLWDNMHKEFKNKNLREHLWKAARALTIDDFNNALKEMENIDKRSVRWLLKTAPAKYWADLYFPGCRYGHLTSNIAESLNSWILEARDMPIHGMFEKIRHQLMKRYIS